MDPAYLQEDFKSSHELEKHQELPSQEKLSDQRKQLMQDLIEITEKASRKILEKDLFFTDDLNKILKIYVKIRSCAEDCKDSRSLLSKSRQSLTTSSLGLLKLERRRQHAQTLLKNLNVIRTLRDANSHIEHDLLRKDFPTAKSVILECQEVCKDLNYLAIVKDLIGKLETELKVTEDELKGTSKET